MRERTTVSTRGIWSRGRGAASTHHSPRFRVQFTQRLKKDESGICPAICPSCVSASAEGTGLQRDGTRGEEQHLNANQV